MSDSEWRYNNKVVNAYLSVALHVIDGINGVSQSFTHALGLKSPPTKSPGNNQELLHHHSRTRFGGVDETNPVCTCECFMVANNDYDQKS